MPSAPMASASRRTPSTPSRTAWYRPMLPSSGTVGATCRTWKDAPALGVLRHGALAAHAEGQPVPLGQRRQVPVHQPRPAPCRPSCR